LDRSLLVKFMQRTYAELSPGDDHSHLAETVEQYFSQATPLWWADLKRATPNQILPSATVKYRAGKTVGCLWMGTAIDQASGDRHAHIFLLYVAPDHRRQGIGTALMHQAETWARSRGDRQIGLQVFQSNQPALELYRQLGYKPRSLWMVKHLDEN
jgi:ribosomal protein S18 acetylase RimI-like enzyme